MKCSICLGLSPCKILLVLEHFSERCSHCKLRQLCWEGKVLFALLSLSDLGIFFATVCFLLGTGRFWAVVFCIFDTQMTVF